MESSDRSNRLPGPAFAPSAENHFSHSIERSGALLFSQLARDELLDPLNCTICIFARFNHPTVLRAAKDLKFDFTAGRAVGGNKTLLNRGEQVIIQLALQNIHRHECNRLVALQDTLWVGLFDGAPGIEIDLAVLD